MKLPLSLALDGNSSPKSINPMETYPVLYPAKYIKSAITGIHRRTELVLKVSTKKFEYPLIPFVLHLVALRLKVHPYFQIMAVPNNGNNSF